MKRFRTTSRLVLMGLAISLAHAAVYDVRQYGAAGDGKTTDTAAINKAINAAHDGGGGTVYFPAGTYLSGSIHLQSNIALFLEQGATLKATSDPNAYDEAEPNQWMQYQDFGHSHFHNSLIWGEGLANVSILGPGRIDGSALTRRGGQRIGNKALALKLCHNVIVRDVSFLLCGHFAILATGVDNLTIDAVKIDTNRDGIDIDSCHNVRISNCSVNSPFDDAIVFKGTHALGFPRDTENVTLINCQVSGYDPGSFLNGTFQTEAGEGPDRGGPTGRIKIGTESEGGFKNITISNCVFVHCRGLALETVDGGQLEDISIANITMRDIVNAPIFLRLGSRLRAPEGKPVGALRRVNISNVIVYNADPRYGSIVSGIPGHDIEDVTFNNIRLYYRGGGTKEEAALQPPENEKMYPEPRMFGSIPAYAFFIRHAKGIELNNVEAEYTMEDWRPPFVLNDVSGATFNDLKAEHAPGVPAFVLENVENFSIHNSPGVPDTHLERAERNEL